MDVGIKQLRVSQIHFKGENESMGFKGVNLVNCLVSADLHPLKLEEGSHRVHETMGHSAEADRSADFFTKITLRPTKYSYLSCFINV